MTEPRVSVPADLTGLSDAEVQQRIAAGDTNVTEDVTSRPLIEIIKANVFTRFNALLGALFVLVVLTGSLKNALFGIPLVLNSLLGIAQEWHAKRKLDSLAVLHAPHAVVVRSGAAMVIASSEVVRDDVVALLPGDQVCADGPVVRADNLEIDESNLTGESDAVGKVVGDRVSSGTAVVAGIGWFTAEIVGPNATAQKLAAEARQFTRTHSEVQHSTNVLLRWLTWIVIIALPITVWSQWSAVGDLGWRQVVLRSAGAMVGLIPEGLVVLTTLAFLLAAVQLTRKQALVQELPAVESLARVDVICVDKTGTLTEGIIALEDIDTVTSDPAVERALGALCHLETANQTARAIAEGVPDPHLSVTDQVPFSSARKWSGGIVEGRAWLLGAPDMILPPDDAVLARVEGLADAGRRVLVLASAEALPAQGQPVSGARAEAVIELSEIVRSDAAETISFFVEQGVRVVVISGDTPRTVAAIAHRVGIDVGEPVDARTLPDHPEQLAEIAETATVFGRVTPPQKRALVRALQSRGHVVAMTGDGVNDVLALKDADIGIAMGNGSQATKAVAQLVLLDSKFSHLPNVLAEGRRLIGNVERVASLFVTKNVMSAITLFAAAILGLAYPFVPSQLTLVSTLTIGIPAAILALGPNKRRYIPGFLSRVLMVSIPAGVISGIAAFTVYAILTHRDVPPEQASTGAIISLLITSFWLLGCLARPYLPWKIAVVAVMVGLAVVAFITPVGREFFALTPTPIVLRYGLIGGAIGAVVVEIAFRLSRHREPPTEAGHRRPHTGEVPSTTERPLGTRPYTDARQGHRVPDVRRMEDDQQ